MRNYRPIDDELDQKEDRAMRLIDMIAVDPMGSYTGLPIAHWETPVQDADDL